MVVKALAIFQSEWLELVPGRLYFVTIIVFLCLYHGVITFKPRWRCFGLAGYKSICISSSPTASVLLVRFHVADLVWAVT